MSDAETLWVKYSFYAYLPNTSVDMRFNICDINGNAK